MLYESVENAHALRICGERARLSVRSTIMWRTRTLYESVERRAGALAPAGKPRAERL